MFTVTISKALESARSITAEILDGECVDDPEELPLPFAEAFRELDEASAIIDYSSVTRLDVVGDSGRILTTSITALEFSIQDDGHTLKIFYRKADSARNQA
jgi:hypothetical protein